MSTNLLDVDHTHGHKGAEALQETQSAAAKAAAVALLALVKKLFKAINNKEASKKKEDNLQSVKVMMDGSEVFRARMNEKQILLERGKSANQQPNQTFSQDQVDYLEEIVKLPASKERHKNLDKNVTITIGTKNVFVLKDGIVEKNLFQEQEKTVNPKETETLKAPEQQKAVDPQTIVNEKPKQISEVAKVLENVSSEEFSQEEEDAFWDSLSPNSEEFSQEEEDAFFDYLSSYPEESIINDEFLDFAEDVDEELDNSLTSTLHNIEETNISTEKESGVKQKTVTPSKTEVVNAQNATTVINANSQEPVNLQSKEFPNEVDGEHTFTKEDISFEGFQPREKIEVEQTKSDFPTNTVLVMNKPLSQEKSTSNLEPSKPNSQENLVSKTVEFLKKTVEVIKNPIKAMKDFTLEENTTIDYFPDEEEELQPKAEQEKQAEPVTPNTGFSSVSLNELDSLFEEETPPTPVRSAKTEQEKPSKPVTPIAEQTKAEPESIPISQADVEIVSGDEFEPESVTKRIEFSSEQRKQLEKDGIDPENLQNIIAQNNVNRSPVIIIINQEIEKTPKPNILKENLQKIGSNIRQSVQDFSKKVSNILETINQEIEKTPKPSVLKENLQKIGSNIRQSVQDFSKKISNVLSAKREEIFPPGRENRKSDLNNLAALSVASALLDRHGKKNAKGVEQFEGKSFRLERSGDNVRVSAKDGRGTILSLDNGKLEGDLKKQDVEQFKAVAKQLDQVHMQGRGRSKQSESEIG